MDQLGQRLCTEILFVRGGTHSDGDRSSDQSGDPTVAETGDAAVTYRTCNSTYWGVPASIPTREVVTVWGRRWIVKESTIPNTGFGIFAMDRVVVEPNTHYERYPQLFPYVGAVYKHRQYRVMKRFMPMTLRTKW
ncbi:hypothetical protein R1sor_011170 [Riccia sorocarpa]|uniref:Uncharacterized protein n=1 Tax=Riccia sorocarpa TaxID=122646 RepID=A0ABD3I3L2_9MARC